MATASQSLYNMSVVTSDLSSSNQALMMPKLQYRFRVLFTNLGVTTGAGLDLTRQVADCSRPSLTFQEITLPVYNSTMYLAGKPQWSPVTINIRDDASGLVAKAIGEQVQLQQDFVEQASAAVGHDYKFMTSIEVLDGGNGTLEPTVLETWELYGCFLSQVNYNSLNYGSNEAATIQIQIRFDNAVNAPLTSGIGQAVGRAFSGSTGITTGIGRSAS